MNTDAIKALQKTVRLFFAIQPPLEIQTALNKTSKKLVLEHGGRCTQPENIHLTLLFMGDVDTDKLDALNAIANGITAEAFSLSIEGTAFWKKNRIVLAQPESWPVALFTLVNTIKTALTNAGFNFDNRKYRPHITLIRNATAHVPVHFENPLEWDVKEWQLIKSTLTDQGPSYVTLGRWPLCSIMESNLIH